MENHELRELKCVFCKKGCGQRTHNKMLPFRGHYVCSECFETRKLGGERMKEEQFIKKLIGLFADKTGCFLQYNNCPCNTCFHSIEEVDFQHICWLILLVLRGDYKGKSQQHILKGIKKELEKD